MKTCKLIQHYTDEIFQNSTDNDGKDYLKHIFSSLSLLPACFLKDITMQYM